MTKVDTNYYQLYVTWDNAPDDNYMFNEGTTYEEVQVQFDSAVDQVEILYKQHVLNPHKYHKPHCKTITVYLIPDKDVIFEHGF